ncbi:PefC/AfrB family outer membrane usher protein [Vibrio vulnificus]|nr:PefC/AfrB family outer membrane usher protein [Vibrio vulnificus]
MRFALSGVCAALMSAQVYASEFNLNFLKGMDVAPSVLRGDVLYPAGMYQVDVWVNGHRIGQSALTISEKEEKNNNLCLSAAWLDKAGVQFIPSFYDSVFDAGRQCYVFSAEKHSKVSFNPSMQQLKIVIPQAYLPQDESQLPWNFGESGARIQYSGNFNVNSDDELNAFGQVEIGLNHGRWRLDGNFNGSHNDESNTISSNKLIITTPIRRLEGDFAFGRNQTNMSLFSDFGYYGASLRSNREMIPWEVQGYAPVISGIADSTSRVTVSQDGYTIYSKVVPPGPYELTDIAPVSNGDLQVTVRGEGGNERTTIYPVSSLPTLLREDESRYDFVVGAKNNSSELKDAFLSDEGLFAMGSFDYGFNSYTLSSASILHDFYQGLGLGLTRSLGVWGAVSIDGAAVSARYEDGRNSDGFSAGVTYAKSFSNRTDIQLLAYRYQSSGYVDFADFDATEVDDDSLLNQRKSRYEARFSHQFDEMYVRGMFWAQNYWDLNGYDIGGNFSIGTQLQGKYPIFINGTYTDSVLTEEPDYAVTFSISIPFTFMDVDHYSYNTLGYSKSGELNANTGVSATVNERLNYNLSANTDKHATSATASVSYAFDAIQTNASISQNDDVTSLSGGISGSVLATSKSGVVFTGEVADTVAIVKLGEVSGVTFNDSLPTNDNGITVVRLSNYDNNTVSINPLNVPDNVELSRTSYSTVPTEHALVYREFEAQKVHRYILRLKDKQGQVLTKGNAFAPDGQYMGFVASNGVLLLNLNQPYSSIKIDSPNMNCRIDMSDVKEEQTTLQEVTCE